MPESSSTRYDVLIAGAGIAGFSAAHVLADAGLRVLVLEKSATAGGKCMSYRDPALGYTVEHGVHGIFPRYVNLRGLWTDAGIPESVYTDTRTTGMAGADRRMHATELARAVGPAPLFLLRLVPRGVFRLRDFLFAFRFLLRSYAASFGDRRTLDETTFGALLRSTGVSARMKQLLLVPYVRNLTYARGDEVSAQVALEALNYYVVEDSDAVKARWFDGGPSELVFEPWRRELERRGVQFAFETPVESVLMSGSKFEGFVSQEVIPERELGNAPRVWTQRLGHHQLGLRWQPEKRKLVALNAVCTHKGCPLTLEGAAAEQHYHCACHGAQFDLDGQVLRAPATRPLEPVAMRHDATSGVWMVDGEGAGAEAVGAAPRPGSFRADYGVLAIDLPGVQKVLPKVLALDEDCAGLPLLRTTSVMVLRLNFRGEPGAQKWSGPDSGVFAADDLLDNFFALHTFQREFAALPELVLECHIGDSERLVTLDDESVFEQALEVLERYFPGERLRARFERSRSRLLRHEGVFSLFAPGDLARTPQVSSARRPNLMFAGDWVQTDEPRHRSFFMERAAVTGIEAANAILRRKGMAAKQRPIASPEPPRLARWLSLPIRLSATLRAGLRRLLALD